MIAANETYKGYTIELHQDDDPSNPRTDYDQASTMVCFHGRYMLGDEGHGFREQDYDSWSELRDGILEENPGAEILPLYLYDHGGITMRTGSFNDPWDSGQVGFIFMSKEKMKETYISKIVTQKVREQSRKLMIGDVKTYDQYLTGDVYGYVVLANGNMLDSCWGFYGSEWAIEEAKSYIDWHIDWISNELDNVRDLTKAIELAGQLVTT